VAVDAQQHAVLLAEAGCIKLVPHVLGNLQHRVFELRRRCVWVGVRSKGVDGVMP
jgi:hypothetical protein